MIIRQGQQSDIEHVLEMGGKFYEESNFEPDGYDPAQLEKILNYTLQGGTHYLLIAEHNDKPIGFIVFDCARHYTKYLVSHMFLLYSDKDHRKHNAGSSLIREACKFAKNKGCKYFYGSGSAEFDDNGRNDRILKRIYERQDFKENGFFMRKEL